VDLFGSNPTAQEPPAPAEPKRPVVASAPVRRPPTSRAPSIDLPAPEFPATYYSESLRHGARAAPPSRPSRPVPLEPAPPPPRLVGVLWGPWRGGVGSAIADHPRSRPTIEDGPQ